MPTGMIYVGDIATLPDEAAADLLRNPSKFRDEVDKKIVDDVPAIVVTELGKAPTVVAGAEAAVDDVLAEKDVLVGGDRRSLPGGPGGKDGWYSMPQESGYSEAYIMWEQRDWYIAGGWTLDGYFEARMKGDGPSGSSLSDSVRDAIIEWWTSRPQQNGDTLTTGGNGNKGAQLAIDFNERTPPTATAFAKVPVDDHNVGSPCVAPNRGILMAWTHHNVDNLLRLSVAGGSGLGSTLRGKPEYTFTMGGNASYAIPWLLAHRRSGTTDTFWIMVRVNLRYSIREIVVDWATNTPTATAGLLHLVEFPEQAYMDAVPAAFDANGNVTKIGIVAGYNPAASRDDVYLLELDLTTGIMHDKANPAVTHNIASGAPLQSTALTPVLANKTTGTRRLFSLHTGNGAQVWKILTCEYTGDVDPSGVITEHSFDVSAKAVTGTRTFGAAGRHLERYPGGACFAADGRVWHVNEANNVYKLSREGVVKIQSAEAIFRPTAAPAESHVEIIYNTVGVYTSFIAWANAVLHTILRGA